jgi:hypothetical protein
VLPGEPLATAEVELYYELGRERRDQGYATEACREMLRFAFGELRLARPVICANRDRQRSIRLKPPLAEEACLSHQAGPTSPHATEPWQAPCRTQTQQLLRSSGAFSP